jgi:hypothetical protein
MAADEQIRGQTLVLTARRFDDRIAPRADGALGS